MIVQCIICDTEFERIRKDKQCCFIKCSKRNTYLSNKDNYNKMSSELRRNKKANSEEYCQRIKKQVKEYSKKNKEKIKDYHKKYYEENREKYLERERNRGPRLDRLRPKRVKKKVPRLDRLRLKRVKKKVPVKKHIFMSYVEKKVHANVSRNMRYSFKGNGLSKDGRKWEDLVGYTRKELMDHLESLFVDGMNWDNYGKFGWHIDHKIPKCNFRFSSADDPKFKKCWGLDNLQPLWAKQNWGKPKIVVG